MARRARREEEYQEQGPGRYPRRRGGNEALWIALGAAVVLGIVFIFIVSGSSGGESNKLEAKLAFENFLKAVLENHYTTTLGLMHLEGMLVEHNPGALKTRSEWTPEKRRELETDLFRHLQIRVRDELRLEGTNDIRRKVLDRAELVWDSYRDEVKIRWTTDGFDKVIAERRLHVPPAPWVATLSEVDGRWLVTGFRPEL